MNFIITGAGGILGKEIIKQLSCNETIKIYALSSQVETLKRMYKNNHNIYVYHKYSLIQNKILLSHSDILINCAFPRGKNGEEFAEGLNYIKETIKVAVKKGIGGVVNISSQSVYNQKRSNPATELSPVHLESIYAVGKYAIELLIETICSETPFTNVRLASLIAPEFEQRVINKLIAQGLEKGKFKVIEGGQYFGFLDVEDAARGILKLASISPKLWKPTYNLGSGKAYSLVEIAEKIVYISSNNFGKKILFETESKECEMNTALDCTLLKDDVGYTPMVSLEESIFRIIQGKIEKSR